MFDDAFRHRFQRAVAPVVAWLARGGVTPNTVTLISFLIALLGAIAVAVVDPRVGALIWLVSRIGDGLDGALARVTGRSSALGGFLDITLDMAAYSAMVLAFAASHTEHPLAWSAVLAGYVIVITTTLALSDAARAGGVKVSETDRTFQFTRGLTEAGETHVAYLIWAFFPASMPWSIWVWVLALLITATQRIHLACRALQDTDA